MKAKNSDLHGAAPDRTPTVLLLVDVISDFEFEDGKALFERALPAAKVLRKLKAKLRSKGIPTIYANDNRGRWRSDFPALVKRCSRRGVRGAPITKLLKPDDKDYFVLKPKHSCFFSTTLDTLLEYLDVKEIIVAGWSTNSCVLFTANDAYVRDYKIVIPKDATAALSDEEQAYALFHFKNTLKAKVVQSEELMEKIGGRKKSK